MCICVMFTTNPCTMQQDHNIQHTCDSTSIFWAGDMGRDSSARVCSSILYRVLDNLSGCWHLWHRKWIPLPPPPPAAVCWSPPMAIVSCEISEIIPGYCIILIQHNVSSQIHCDWWQMDHSCWIIIKPRHSFDKRSPKCSLILTLASLSLVMMIRISLTCDKRLITHTARSHIYQRSVSRITTSAHLNM